MDPELQPRPQSHEQLPESPQSPEARPAPETGAERPAFESEPTNVEQAAAQAGAAATIDPAAIAIPQPALPVADNTAAVAGDDDLPLLASDDDLIEKEWVDKAKQVISATKDDPNRREREIAKLQADYLKKRYGKELGTDDV